MTTRQYEILDQQGKRINELTIALARLVALKEHKDTKGKTTYYEQEQPKAWAYAKEVLNKKL